MDTEVVGFEEFRECLRDLERVNTWIFAYRPTFNWLNRVLRQPPSGTADDVPDGMVRIVDVASGGGDMLRRIWHWAARRGIVVDLTGVDLNPWSARSAALDTPAEAPIRYVTADIFAFVPERPVDFVISSHFAHHLPDADLVRFIQWMDRTARRGWFINDLHRHPLAHFAARRGLPILSSNRLVTHDGPASVRRALAGDDWRRILLAAGVADRARARWYAPFRWGVEGTPQGTAAP
jgi:SAM-dependent methyltransferase